MRPPPSDAGTGTPLTERLRPVAEAVGRRAGAVVAVRTANESATWCRGFGDRTRGTPVTDRTRFELGSATKTFTALLLADLAVRGTVRLDEPLSGLVPPWALPRGPAGGRITLEHLATHTAGLPRLPPGLLLKAVPSWFGNPYAAYPPEELPDSLARSRVRGEPGHHVRYSNFGVGLLGHLLAEAAATPYGALLRARVLEPLGLTDTTDDAGTDQATGYWHGRPRRPWLIPGLPGAGVLRSSARDLLRYLWCLVDPEDGAVPGTPLRSALREVVRPGPRAPGGPELCLVWSRRALPTRTLYFHSGGTRGFTTFVGFSTSPAVAVAALTNTSPTLRGRFIQDAYLLLRELAAPAA
ncbi:serine hydrolase domain-containing protein [Streptomyces litchfieldiae]|uniref:Serine hydrolase domain-containing protein n=1 Tax=Streptomyces litchfieldiae TaxID=3075543 RepID=A0ABU2MYR6_9ACTN|nr:serine hydrolase domain-containing protein [Streptomyces sp. DSM 44938]MDT0346184.1 serine hydrolase domain-containing protein [Streptomyces sp. DSM 44938]